MNDKIPWNFDEKDAYLRAFVGKSTAEDLRKYPELQSPNYVNRERQKALEARLERARGLVGKLFRPLKEIAYESGRMPDKQKKRDAIASTLEEAQTFLTEAECEK